MPEIPLLSGKHAQDLRQGLKSLGENPDNHPLDSYFRYLELLLKWNRTYNLSGINDPKKMLYHHILDSLSLLPYLNGRTCLDVGSGAGLPGLVLAMANPEVSWTLLDSSGKKIRFLNHAILELALQNAQAVKCRLEDYIPDQLFTCMVSRAMAPTATLLKQLDNLLTENGRLIMMKGPDVSAEIENIDDKEINIELIEVAVPGVQAGRTLIKIDRTDQK